MMVFKNSASPSATNGTTKA